MDYHKLKSGSDIRGVAIEGPDSPVTLSDRAAMELTAAFAVWLARRTGRSQLTVAGGMTPAVGRAAAHGGQAGPGGRAGARLRPVHHAGDVHDLRGRADPVRRGGDDHRQSPAGRPQRPEVRHCPGRPGARADR